jgi:hypothetical protein
MANFELKRTSEIVELLENVIVEMLQTKKVNATVLKCYIDLIKLTQQGNKNDSLRNTHKLFEKILS